MNKGIYGSWEIISDNEILKITDRSVFKYGGSAIAKDVYEFFEIEYFKMNKKLGITIFHKNKEYKAYMIKDKQGRIRLFWKGLKNVLINYFPEYDKFFNVKKETNQNSPIMYFTKINSLTYNLEFIFRGKVDNNIIEYEEDYYSDSKILNVKEGKEIYHAIKAYERNKKNRLIAIKLHGTKCKVCGFDFEKIYGERGKGFIEIHHINPLSNIKEEVIINPKTDLIPVCSNCHRMIHREKDNILSVDEIKGLLNR